MGSHQKLVGIHLVYVDLDYDMCPLLRRSGLPSDIVTDHLQRESLGWHQN
jgi:hypothetical protein